MQICQQLLPGYGEERILNGLPREVRAFLSAAIEEEPWFLHEYLLPTLAGLDGAEKIIDDLSYALAAVELEEEIYGVEPDDGFLGKSLKSKLKKVVKKVVAPVKKTVEVVKKVTAPLQKIADKVHEPLKEITKKAGAAIQKAAKSAGTGIQREAKSAGQSIKHAAKTGKLQVALAPFTLGVSLLAHPKVGQAAKKFMATPYGNVVIGALGAIFAVATGGASVAAAAALTTANTMYQKKKAAEEARAAAKGDAVQLQAEADQLGQDTDRQLSEFYTQNAALFEQHGVTRSMWDGMSRDEKIGLLDGIASGTWQATQQPAPQGSAPSGGGGGGGAPSGGGGGGGGGSDGGGYSSGGGSGQPGGQVVKAGMGDLLMPAMVGIGILAVLSQSKKKGRSRRNPGRRRVRWSA